MEPGGTFASMVETTPLTGIKEPCEAVSHPRIMRSSRPEKPAARADKHSSPIAPLAILCAMMIAAPWPAGVQAAPDRIDAFQPEPARARELVTMVRQDCGSCHGLSLAGGLGPALLPKDLADKPFDSLVATVMQGRPGSAMPGWSRFMNEDEAQWIVRELVKGFPELPIAEK